MKVIIITEGYKSTGYGHITRCLSLYQAFRDKNINPKFIINGDEGAKLFLENAEYLMLDWINNSDRLFEQAASSDIIIIDSYKAEEGIYSRLYDTTRVLAVLDDYLRIDYKAHIIINGTIGSQEFLYNKNENTKYLLGAEYIPLRKEFWDVKEKEIVNYIESVLITFGGQDVRDLTEKVLDYLPVKEPDLKYYVVAKKDFNIDFEKFSSMRNIKFVYDATASEMKELMLKCDIAITAAGQTIYELARVGVPSIAVIVAGNQIRNLQEWTKNGFIQDELYHDDPELLSKIKAGISNLNRKYKRAEMSRRGRTTIDGQGAERVVNFLAELKDSSFKSYFRKAEIEDAKLVFKLSNDPVVRKNSINQTIISWEDHLNWFSSHIKDANYFFHLHFTNQNVFVGQVRFGIECEHAVVSISIVEEFRGKGLSTKILIDSCSSLFSNYSNVSFIKAYIKPENISSIKGFLNAGFAFKTVEIFGGESYNLYILTR